MRSDVLDTQSKCPRCLGLLVMEYLVDFTNGDRAEAWACVLCGNKLDSTILANRALHEFLETT